MSAAAVAELKELESLRIYWRKPPGRLVDAAALAGLPRLAVIQLVDGYGLDADTLPDMASMTQLSISGLRRSIVPAMKARYRGTACTWLPKARSPTPGWPPTCTTRSET